MEVKRKLKKKKSGFGILKGIGSFTKDDEMKSCVADKD